MKLTMLLCDAAQAVNGKLYILGGGWNITGPQPGASAIALQIDVPWDEANKRHDLKLVLVTDDGKPVMVPTPTGERPVELGAQFEVGRPAGHRAGAPISVAVAINIGPLPLQPDGRFEWRCSINDDTHESWRLVFSTRPTPEKQPPRV
jgi:hypothetical protein